MQGQNGYFSAKEKRSAGRAGPNVFVLIKLAAFARPDQNSSKNRIRNRRPLILLFETRENACLAICRSSAT